MSQSLEKLWSLLGILVDGSLYEAQRDELESLLLESEEALLGYVDFAAMHSELSRIHDRGKPEMDVVTGKDEAESLTTGHYHRVGPRLPSYRKSK